jgi:hypothetical protein
MQCACLPPRPMPLLDPPLLDPPLLDPVHRVPDPEELPERSSQRRGSAEVSR